MNSALMLALASQLVRRFEGFSAVPYYCPANYPTIGFGRVCGPQGGPLPAITTTVEAELAWLQREIKRVAAKVLLATRVPLADGQLAALVDFSYNLGVGAYQISTLRQKLNRGEYEDAAEQFLRWVFAGNKKLRGLVARRAAEKTLFLA